VVPGKQIRVFVAVVDVDGRGLGERRNPKNTGISPLVLTRVRVTSATSRPAYVQAHDLQLGFANW